MINLFIPEGTEIVTRKVIERLFTEFTDTGDDIRSKDVIRVILPDSVTKIGDYVFKGWTNLEDINLSSKITDIETSAFYGCKSLKIKADLSGLQHIGDKAFSNSGIKKVKFSNELKYIGNEAFSGTKLKSVKIPGSVEEIGVFSFSDCKKLWEIKIKEGVETICEGAFSKNDNLDMITLPDSLRYIQNEAFAYCDNLDSIQIPKKVKEIASDAFLKSGIMMENGTVVWYKDKNIGISICKEEGMVSLDDITGPVYNYEYWED